MNGLELSEIQICAPVNYLLHMKKHCKHYTKFWYFWTPVLVTREEPVLWESSNLQHEVCKKLEHIIQVQTLNFVSMFGEMTTGSCGTADLDHFSCMFHIMYSNVTEQNIIMHQIGPAFKIQHSVFIQKHLLSKNQEYKTWQNMHSHLIAFYMRTVYVIIDSQNKIDYWVVNWHYSYL